MEPEDGLGTQHCTRHETVQLKIAHVVSDQRRPEVRFLPSQAHMAERKAIDMPEIKAVSRQRSKHIGFRVVSRPLAHVKTRNLVLTPLERYVNVIQAHIFDAMAWEANDGARAQSSGGNQIFDRDVAK